MLWAAFRGEDTINFRMSETFKILCRTFLAEGRACPPADAVTGWVYGTWGSVAGAEEPIGAGGGVAGRGIYGLLAGFVEKYVLYREINAV